MFRPLIGHLQALWRTDPRTIYISIHCGIPNAYMLCYRNVKYVSGSWICSPEGLKMAY